jgi:hypothetical protein
MADLGGDKRVAETAEYIHGIARELEAMASRAQLGFLAYLLSMVEQEARRLADDAKPASARGT